MQYRTHKCGELRICNQNEVVTLSGWVQKSRRMGQIVFVDIRDKSGITQIVFPADSKLSEKANSLRNEFVITISGKVSERKSKNSNMVTGDIEIIAEELVIISTAETTPLIIADETDALEDVRMRYRYLDIRRNPVRKILELRHKVVHTIRNFLNDKEFLDVETPMLTRGMPEGARNFLIPSRVNAHLFYALPQSPQIFKQLLMVGGIERYYQVVRCFRDEDLRIDRQPEFTQLDMEVSFLNKNDFQKILEEMMQEIISVSKNIDIKLPFEKISYDDAISRFGSDKPDMRFGMELNNVTDLFASSEFKVFSSAKMINVIVVEEHLLDKKQIEKAEHIAKEHGAKGLAWVHVKNNKAESPIAKFCETQLMEVIKKLDVKSRSTLLFVADSKEVSRTSLGSVRNFLADILKITSKDDFKFVWVEDWPLFEYNEEEKRYVSAHHPFTAPTEETLSLLGKNPELLKAQAYDMVLNGVEIGGGSVRIFNQDIQTKIFKSLGLTSEKIQKEFGFFTEALKYGTPPHCGVAFGIDRIIMLLADGASSIKDVIAFPKNSSAICMMTNAPSMVTDEELKVLKIKKA